MIEGIQHLVHKSVSMLIDHLREEGFQTWRGQAVDYNKKMEQFAHFGSGQLAVSIRAGSIPTRKRGELCK